MLASLSGATRDQVPSEISLSGSDPDLPARHRIAASAANSPGFEFPSREPDSIKRQLRDRRSYAVCHVEKLLPSFVLLWPRLPSLRLLVFRHELSHRARSAFGIFEFATNPMNLNGYMR